jgi:hypothetical protein
MGKPILQKTLNTRLFVGELCNREKCEEYIGTQRCPGMNLWIDVRKADEKRVCHLISTNDQNVRLIRREDNTQ